MIKKQSHMPDDPGTNLRAYGRTNVKGISMTTAGFKMMLGMMNMIAMVIGPYAAGMPFSMQTLLFNIVGVLSGGHAVTSGMTQK